MAEKKRTTVARVWTKAQCKETLQQGVDNGFKVVDNGGLTKVMDGDTMVVSWLKKDAVSDLYIVRMDTRYFEG